MLKQLQGLVLGLIASFCWIAPTTAQTVAPTFGRGDTGTVVEKTGADEAGTFTITGGSQQLNTLFHSFEAFSPENADVLFQLSNTQNTIEQIVARVTGANISLINGQLALTGGNAPNLFLINPNGIHFGADAHLSLPSSFVASTADTAVFSDGQQFSAIDPQAAPLLTVSAPIGLQFSTELSNAISLEGNGHAVSATNPLFSPYSQSATSGLSVAEGTLALIGGSIALEGASISASGGHVVLGSVSEGTVTLSQQGNSLTADYANVGSFGDITLQQQSLVDVSGSSAGSSQIQGRNISLTDGSIIWSQNRGSNAAGSISINAANQLLIEGTSPTVTALSGVMAETIWLGAASDVEITATDLVVQDGATLLSRSFSPGSSGSVAISAEQATVKGHAPVAPNLFTQVGTTSFVSGQTGDVTANLQSLSVVDGGYFGSTTLGSARGGSVTISADSVDVVGTTPTGIPSLVTANTAGRGGDSGDIEMTTRELTVRDGGIVTTTSLGVGNAGDVDIQASERIEIRRDSPDAKGDSTIASTVDFPPLSYEALLGVSGQPRGSSGSVMLTTPELTVQGIGSSIAVLNRGEGNGGQVQIDAGSIFLDQGYITAVTTNGNGGNIDLQVEVILFARDGGRIETSAQGIEGNGGNIQISAPLMLGINDSDIVANAFGGNGGNIDVSTRALLGWQFREQLTPNSDITASSEFGISGNVAINDFDAAPDSGLVELPKRPANADNQVIAGCSAAGDNEFVVSGRGGISLSPQQATQSNRPWSDLREFSALAAGSLSYDSSQALSPTPSHNSRLGEPPNELAEAALWQTNALGQVELVVIAPQPPSNIAAQAACMRQT